MRLIAQYGGEPNQRVGPDLATVQFIEQWRDVELRFLVSSSLLWPRCVAVAMTWASLS